MNEKAKRLLFIYNPNAGKGTIKDHLSQILSLFDAHGFETTCYETTGPKDGMRKAASDGASFDRIVCYGGDGTLNEIVSGVMQLDTRPQIGFIPAGSTNDTAKNFGLPHNIEEAALIAASGRPMKIDVGSLGDLYFVYVASFGDISAVSAFTPQEEKKRFGHAAYIMEGIRILPKMKYQPIEVTYDGGEPIEGEFYLGMITNSFQVGGFPGITGKTVDLQDGLFEVMMLAKPRNILDWERQIAGVLIRKDDQSIDVEYGKLMGKENGIYELVTKFKASDITFRSTEEVQWVVDGEDAGRYKEISLKNHRQAIEIMVK